MQNLILKIELPVYYTVERKKPKKVKTKKGIKLVYETTHLVNLNWYRNAFFILQNQVKQHYHNLTETALKSQKTKKVYQYITKSNYYFKTSSSDASNVVPMIEKFILDSLQELNITEEDNVKHHIGSDGWRVFEDKANPRIEFYLYEVIND